MENKKSAGEWKKDVDFVATQNVLENLEKAFQSCFYSTLWVNTDSF